MHFLRLIQTGIFTLSFLSLTNTSAYENIPQNTMYVQIIKPKSSKKAINNIGPNCKEALLNHNDEFDKRVNLIFVNIGYPEKKFQEAVDNAIDYKGKKGGILSIEPFKSNYTNMNYVFVNKSKNLPTSKIDSDEWRKEIKKTVISLGNECNLKNKVILGLVNEDFRSRATLASNSTLRFDKINMDYLSIAKKMAGNTTLTKCEETLENKCNENISWNFLEHKLDICKSISLIKKRYAYFFNEDLCRLVTNSDPDYGVSWISYGEPNVVVHELGHAFAGLDDEYLDKDEVGDKEKLLSNSLKYPINCFVTKTKKECKTKAPWAHLIKQKKAGCYKGCNYVKKIKNNHFWRSIKKGKMKTSQEPTFGAWNITRICDVFYTQTQNPLGICTKYGSYIKQKPH